MTGITRLAIAGDTDLARDMVRFASGHAVAPEIVHRTDPHDIEPGDGAVVSVASRDQRAAFAQAAVDAGCQVTTLPIADLSSLLDPAIADGNLRQISAYFGHRVVARLAGDVHDGRAGRIYGLFASHQHPQGSTSQIEQRVGDLLALAAEVVPSPISRVQATRATFDGGDEAWLLLVRFEDDTIATLECAASLPRREQHADSLLVEVTGSAAVLRAEPGRQSVRVLRGGDQSRVGWAPNPASSLLQRALETPVQGSPVRQSRLVAAARAVRVSADSGEPVSLTSGR
jgi:hypothetical protein